ncbi:hypothetical protein CANARDRAFT_21956 [[Candida] arabinofermentans NRRL YB-2248]|uniref:Phospholipid/glycerol acyltransferase domain-containing protein n=1 Tax=[Candida] arabinofermentans NRRL YB-2248 TaxID=983967 RepID=A0A1E4T5D9_9ASCO|nr:hypothetical protein CANARDRAFT_21956 [[Candida] arabinofermentans NRRL YB-2248]
MPCVAGFESLTEAKKFGTVKFYPGQKRKVDLIDVKLCRFSFIPSARAGFVTLKSPKWNNEAKWILREPGAEMIFLQSHFHDSSHFDIIKCMEVHIIRISNWEMLQSSSSNFSYELFIWFLQIVTDIFFREVSIRGSYNVPTSGPTIVVIAPHANQFLDAALTTMIIYNLTGRRTSFIEAAVSFKRKVIGAISKWAGAIPVERAQDMLEPKQGTIRYKNYPTDEVTIIGEGTMFTRDLEVKGLIGLPKSSGNAKISEIINDTEFKIAKPFQKSKAIELMKNGTAYKSAKKVDNGLLFKNVFDHLHTGGLIAIASEGGSHDRTELLPLKPGVGIMALGAAAEYPGIDISIVPCGMNYFHPHKFRSRAVLEFGSPIVVGEKDGLKYKENSRKCVDQLMERITTSLKSVTVQSPDYETLQVIQTARRLYSYPRRPVPLPLVVEMNRNLSIGYSKFKDDPEIQHLKQSVMLFNKQLGYLGLKYYQVDSASRNVYASLLLLIKRIVELLFLVVLSLPGTILFSPVFIACKIISKKKQREALAGSAVKIKAIDVLGSWKVLIALVVAPILYLTYSLIGTSLVLKYDLIPNWLSFLKFKVVVFAFCWALLVSTTYAAFRMGEVGMDIFKSLKPLIINLGSSSRELMELKKEKERLTLEVTKVVNELGPRVFPKFNTNNLELIHSQLEKEQQEISTRSRSISRSRSRSRSRSCSRALSRASSSVSVESGFSDHEKLPNLSDVSLFPDILQMKDEHSTESTSTDEIEETIRAKETPESDLRSRITSAVLKKNMEQFIQTGEQDSD